VGGKVRRVISFSVRGEGPNDYGVVDLHTGQIHQEGCYAAFLAKAASRHKLTCVGAGPFPKKLPGGKRKPALRGFERHSFYATLEAVEQGARCVVIGTDTDRGLKARRRHLPKACLAKYAQLHAGHQKAVQLRPEAANVVLVCLVPLVKLETWLLADPRSTRRVAGFDRGELPKKPEELYGQTDAKELLNGLFRSHRMPKPDTEVKAQMAAEARPDVLAQQCPVSYPPFLECVSVLLARPQPKE